MKALRLVSGQFPTVAAHLGESGGGGYKNIGAEVMHGITGNIGAL